MGVVVLLMLMALMFWSSVVLHRRRQWQKLMRAYEDGEVGKVIPFDRR